MADNKKNDITTEMDWVMVDLQDTPLAVPEEISSIPATPLLSVETTTAPAEATNPEGILSAAWGLSKQVAQASLSAAYVGAPYVLTAAQIAGTVGAWWFGGPICASAARAACFSGYVLGPVPTGYIAYYGYFAPAVEHVSATAYIHGPKVMAAAAIAAPAVARAGVSAVTTAVNVGTTAINGVASAWNTLHASVTGLVAPTPVTPRPKTVCPQFEAYKFNEMDKTLGLGVEQELVETNKPSLSLA